MLRPDVHYINVKHSDSGAGTVFYLGFRLGKIP